MCLTCVLNMFCDVDAFPVPNIPRTFFGGRTRKRKSQKRKAKKVRKKRKARKRSPPRRNEGTGDLLRTRGRKRMSNERREKNVKRKRKKRKLKTRGVSKKNEKKGKHTKRKLATLERPGSFLFFFSNPSHHPSRAHPLPGHEPADFEDCGCSLQGRSCSTAAP